MSLLFLYLLHVSFVSLSLHISFTSLQELDKRLVIHLHDDHTRPAGTTTRSTPSIHRQERY